MPEDADIIVPVRCGIVGFPVVHSRSPEIQRAFAKQAGIALEYVRIDAAPEEFEKTVSAFFEHGGFGLNVTLPHKQAALAFAGEADASAKSAGVANVLTRLADGRVRASNTDGVGFVRDLLGNHGFDFTARRVLMLGAGGAAAGIAPRLLAMGVDVLVVFNRTPDRAASLVKRLGDRRAAQFTQAAEQLPFDLVVNATSASLDAQEPEQPQFTLAPNALACDLVYSDVRTPFLKHMQSLGARTIDGWGMLVEQAAESFFIWHGIRPDTAPLLHRTPPAQASAPEELDLI